MEYKNTMCKYEEIEIKDFVEARLSQCKYKVLVEKQIEILDQTLSSEPLILFIQINVSDGNVGYPFITLRYKNRNSYMKINPMEAKYFIYDDDCGENNYEGSLSEDVHYGILKAMFEYQMKAYEIGREQSRQATQNGETLKVFPAYNTKF